MGGVRRTVKCARQGMRGKKSAGGGVTISDTFGPGLNRREKKDRGRGV